MPGMEDETIAPTTRVKTLAAIQRVVVMDIDMPFGSMIAFMVKWAFAAIPALLILGIVGFFVSALLAAYTNRARESAKIVCSSGLFSTSATQCVPTSRGLLLLGGQAVRCGRKDHRRRRMCLPAFPSG